MGATEGSNQELADGGRDRSLKKKIWDLLKIYLAAKTTNLKPETAYLVREILQWNGMAKIHTSFNNNDVLPFRVTIQSMACNSSSYHDWDYNQINLNFLQS